MSKHPHPRRAASPLKDFESPARLLRAAGDPERLRLLHLLSKGPLCVSAVAEATREPLPTVSRRLRILCDGGFLSRRRDGKHVDYFLKDKHITAILLNALKHAGERH